MKLTGRLRGSQLDGTIVGQTGVILRTQVVIFAAVTALAAPVSGRQKVPDVIPGEPWRLLRVLTAGPFRFRILQSAKERSLESAVVQGSVTEKVAWTTIDVGYVGDRGIGDNPAALVVTATPIDGGAPDLFLVHVGTSLNSGGPVTPASQFLVRRDDARARLVCRLPDEPVEIAILETRPALAFTVSAAAERIRFVAGQNELCELKPSQAQAPAPEKNLLFEATVAQGEMFRASGAWKKAGDAFQQALHLRPTGREAEWLARSAIDVRSNYNDIGCWLYRDDLRERPIGGLLKLLLDSYDDYLSLFPKTEYAAQVRYRKADQLERCNHLEAAALLFKEVFEGSPKDELSPYARQHHDAVVDLIRQREQKPSSTKGAAAQPRVEPDGPATRGPTP